MPIPDVLKSVADVEKLIIDAMKAIQGKSYFKILEILPDLITIFKDLKLALPELKKMDADDAKAFLQAVIAAVEQIVAALA